MAKKPRRPTKPRATKASTRRHVPTRGLYGWITHTDRASTDPAATKAWCAKVLGWTFKPSFPMPGGGEIHLFAYSERGSGAIRPINPPEVPGSMPYVHVADARRTWSSRNFGGEVRAVRPDEGLKLRMNRDLLEVVWVAEWLEHLAPYHSNGGIRLSASASASR